MRVPALLIIASLSFAAAAAAPAPALAAKAPVYTSLLGGKVAVSGYDPVAYFTDGTPVKGDKQYSLTHDGVEYHFASAQSLATFRADPARYAPQYGGYCAWAVSQGYTAPGSPTVWKVVHGKLYLNYNEQVGERWIKNIPGFIKAADQNWPKVLSK